MRISWVFASIFCSMIALAFTNRLNPCLTVVLMDTHRDARWSKIDIKSYPIAVCIAGYSSYDFYHKITDKNGTRHLGIFGIREDNLGKCNEEGDPKGKVLNRMSADNYVIESNFVDEVRCLANTVLNSKDTIQFYEKLCQPHLVVNVPCSTTNNQSTGVIQVYDPINKDLADRIYIGETDLNDELITGIKKTSTTEMAHTSESATGVTLESELQTSTTQKSRHSTFSDEANKKTSSTEMAHTSMPVRKITPASATESESSTTQKPLVIINDGWNKHRIRDYDDEDDVYEASAWGFTLESELQTSTTQKSRHSTFSDEANKETSSTEMAHTSESARKVTLEHHTRISTTQKPQTVITIDCWNEHKLIVTIILLAMTFLLGTVGYFLMRISKKKNQIRFQASARYDNNIPL